MSKIAWGEMFGGDHTKGMMVVEGLKWVVIVVILVLVVMIYLETAKETFVATDPSKIFENVERTHTGSDNRSLLQRQNDYSSKLRQEKLVGFKEAPTFFENPNFDLRGVNDGTGAINPSTVTESMSNAPSSRGKKEQLSDKDLQKILHQ